MPHRFGMGDGYAYAWATPAVRWGGETAGASAGYPGDPEYPQIPPTQMPPNKRVTPIWPILGITWGLSVCSLSCSQTIGVIYAHNYLRCSQPFAIYTICICDQYRGSARDLSCAHTKCCIRSKTRGVTAAYGTCHCLWLIKWKSNKWKVPTKQTAKLPHYVKRQQIKVGS